MKPYDVGMSIGRFQHIHKGHEHMLDTMRLLCQRPYIFVGSAQEYGTRRNPFKIDTRIKMIKAVYGDEVIVRPLNDLSNENDLTPDWGKYLMNSCKQTFFKIPEVMVYGNDDSRSQWFVNNPTKPRTEVIVDRADIDISATEVRIYLMLDMRQEWMKWVSPRLHMYYEELRSELMAVPYYRNLYNVTFPSVSYLMATYDSNTDSPENQAKAVREIVDIVQQVMVKVEAIKDFEESKDTMKMLKMIYKDESSSEPQVGRDEMSKQKLNVNDFKPVLEPYPGTDYIIHRFMDRK